MSKPDVTFVNHVSVSGFLNGVVNLSLGRVRWEAEGDTVKASVEAGADLRFDLYCAQQIRDALDAIIEQQITPPKAN